MRWGHDFTSLAGLLIAGFCALAFLTYAVALVWAGVRQSRTRVNFGCRSSSRPSSAMMLRRVEPSSRPCWRRRCSLRSWRSRDPSSAVGPDRARNQSRCGRRAGLFEEHVRARHRAESHLESQGRCRPPDSRPGRRPLRRRGVRWGTAQPSLDERRGRHREFFRQLEPNDMPVGGTATARALERARELIAHDPKSLGHVRVIVLVTDGEDLEGDPLEVARLAGDGTRIDVVQIGGRAPEVIPDVNPTGNRWNSPRRLRQAADDGALRGGGGPAGASPRRRAGPSCAPNTGTPESIGLPEAFRR